MATRKKAAAAAETPVDTPPTDAPATTTGADKEAMPFDKMVRIYRKIGDRITETKATYDALLEELTAQQDVIKTAMRDYMKEQNATSIKTPYGLAIMSKTTRYSTNDWDGFKKFVVEHDALDLFEKRIAQKNMAEFREANPDLLPQDFPPMLFSTSPSANPLQSKEATT